jgi:hypothetical protein
MIAGLLFCNSLDFFSTNFASEKNITEDLMVAGSNPAGGTTLVALRNFCAGPLLIEFAVAVTN